MYLCMGLLVGYLLVTTALSILHSSILYQGCIKRSPSSVARTNKDAAEVPSQDQGHISILCHIYSTLTLIRS